MTRLSGQQVAAIEGAVWMFGLAALFATGFWWPGIMFVIGVSSLVAGLARGHGWAALQGAVWCIGFGAWAMLHYNIAVLFVILGLSTLAGAFRRPPFLGKPKPNPNYDPLMD